MIFKLSIRLFLREVKSGYLTSMLVSLILAITIVSGISLFTDRLEKALNSETEEFLGGKLKFESNNNDLFERINESYKDSQHTEMALFASVIFSDDEMQLSSIKAVDDSYPIIGELELKNSSKIYSTTKSPEKGTVWMDERLKNLLSLSYGDEVFIGDASLIFTDTIIYEPDRASGNLAFAPKTIMNISDLEKLKLFNREVELNITTSFQVLKKQSMP